MNKEQASEFKKHSFSIVKLLGELFKSDFMFKSKNKNMKNYVPMLRESLFYINEELDNANAIIENDETIVSETIENETDKSLKKTRGISVMFNLPELADLENELTSVSEEISDPYAIKLVSNEIKNIYDEKDKEPLVSSSLSSLIDKLKFEEEKVEKEKEKVKIPENALINDISDRSRSHSRSTSRRSSIKNSITEDSMKKLLDDSKELKESKESKEPKEDDVSTPNKILGLRPAVRKIRAPYSSPKK